MSSDLEHRLEGLLAEAPEPDPGAGEESLHRALRALQPAAPTHRGLRTAVLVFAAAAVLLAIAAGSLAAAGALHVTFGAKPKPRPATSQLVLPQGANGIATVVDGRLSVVTKGGVPLQGLPVSAAALSPHALFVAAGIGNSLVAMAPAGRRAWSHPAGGKVVAIAWAPDGLRIAYVVHAGHRFALHVIYGNGIHDTTIDRSVRAARPSWRADSLAVAYVGGGGRAVVYDLGHTSHRVVGSTAPAAYLAYAPSGDSLAVGSLGAVSLVSGNRTVHLGVHADVEALGWLGANLAVAQEMGDTEPLVRTFARSGRQLAGFRVPGRVIAVTGDLVVTQTPDRILAGWWGREKRVTTILRPKRGTSIGDLGVD
jgi:hypothetical protein